MNNIYAIAKRELQAIYTSAIAWVFLTAFLLLNGFVFWLLLRVGAKPGMETATEALRLFFGGTFFYWLFILAMIPLITMRLIAEEKRTGTIETLLTAPVSDWELVLGKFAAALGFYISLWLPSVVYVAIMSAYGELDWGPIGAGYLGILLTGGALIALGVFTSSMTQNQIVAAILCFMLLLLVFSLGLLEQVIPGEGAQQSAFKYINIWSHTDDFSRGIVDSRPVIYNLSLLLAGLFGAVHILGWRHRNAANRIVHYAVNLAILVVGALALIVMANYLALRHYQRGDWTADNYYTLSEQTENVVKGLAQPVDVIVFSSSQSQAFGDIRELLERYGALSTLLKVEYLDPYRNPARAQLLVQQYQLSGADKGTIIFACGEKRKFIAETDLFDFDYSASTMGMGYQEPDMKNFRGEEKFTAALLEVTQPGRPLICFVGGHGEPPLAPLRELLTRENLELQDVNLLAAGKVPDNCAALVLVAPKQPLHASELAAISTYLDGGGHALLALDPVVQAGNELRPTGLESLVARYGVTVNNDIVIEKDPANQVPDFGAGAVLTRSYGSHAITAPLTAMDIPSVFLFARSLAGSDTLPPGVSVTTLVSSSATSWGERDFAVPDRIKKDANDFAGPCALALAVANDSTGMRAIVFGDGDFMAEQLQGINTQLVRNCINFLAERPQLVGIPPRNPKSVKLTLSDEQVTNFFWVTVVLIPLGTLLAGIYVWLRRRF